MNENAGARAQVAADAWRLAKERGDERLAAAALAAYRRAWAEVRAFRRDGMTLREAMAAEDRTPYGVVADRGIVASLACDNLLGQLPVPADPSRRLLTPREREVLAVMAEGVTYPAAAKRLGISARTARNTAYLAFGRLATSGLIETYSVLGWLAVPR